MIWSTAETSGVRPTGGGSAATSSPWYRRVWLPATVPDAYPPIPLVTSHSRDSAAARSPQISRPNWTSACSGTHRSLVAEDYTRPGNPGPPDSDSLLEQKFKLSP